MQVRDFLETDYPMLCDWFKGHDMRAPELELLPPTGYVAGETAIGFLYKSDGKVCWIENYITDPKSDIQTRNMALELLTEALLNEATGPVIALSYVSAIIDRAKKWGFRIRPHVSMLRM